MLVDADGSVYLSGRTRMGSACFTPGVRSYGPAVSTPADMEYNTTYIVRYRRNGQFSWVQWLHDIYSNVPVNSYVYPTYGRRILQAGPNKSLYVTGTLIDAMNFAGHQFQKPDSAAERDYMLACLDTLGALQWAHQRPASAGLQGKVSLPGKHTALVNSSFYLFSETEGTRIWGGGVTTYVPGAHRATLTAYSTSGAPQWAKTTGSAYTITQKVVANDKMVWIAGCGQDSTALRFDTVSVPVSPMAYTPYLAALALRALPASMTVAAAPAEPGWKLWPNPAHGVVSLSLPEAGTLRLLDASGAVARAASFSPGSNVVPVADLPRGVYFAELRTATGVWVRRVVLD